MVPVILWGTQRMMTKDHPRDFSRGKTISISVGTPMHPTGDDPAAETAELHRVMSSMLDEAIRAYPSAEQPPGCWWLPQRYGGSAPTLDAGSRARRGREARARGPQGGARTRTDPRKRLTYQQVALSTYCQVDGFRIAFPQVSGL